MWDFMISTKGYIHQLFPNPYVENNRVQSDTIHRIPDERYGVKLLINPPRGDVYFFALAMTTREDIRLPESQFETTVEAYQALKRQLMTRGENRWSIREIRLPVR